MTLLGEIGTVRWIFFGVGGQKDVGRKEQPSIRGELNRESDGKNEKEELLIFGFGKGKPPLRFVFFNFSLNKTTTRSSS